MSLFLRIIHSILLCCAQRFQCNGRKRQNVKKIKKGEVSGRLMYYLQNTKDFCVDSRRLIVKLNNKRSDMYDSPWVIKNKCTYCSKQLILQFSPSSDTTNRNEVQQFDTDTRSNPRWKLERTLIDWGPTPETAVSSRERTSLKPSDGHTKLQYCDFASSKTSRVPHIKT